MHLQKKFVSFALINSLIMKTLINLIVFLSLVSFATISCTKKDANTEITNSAINLDTSKYAFYNNVELDLGSGFNYTSPIITDTIYHIWFGDTIDILTVNYRVKFDLTNQQFKQSQINTTDLYTRQVSFNGSIITDDTLFVDDGTNLVPNYMYITQEPATNLINAYTHYLIPSFTFDLDLINNAGTSEEYGITYHYTQNDPPPNPNKPSVNFSNDFSPVSGTLMENNFILDGQILYVGQQTTNCQISENYDTITGDYSGTIKVTYKLNYIDNFYNYGKQLNVVDYVDIENGDLLMIKEEL